MPKGDRLQWVGEFLVSERDTCSMGSEVGQGFPVRRMQAVLTMPSTTQVAKAIPVST